MDMGIVLFPQLFVAQNVFQLLFLSAKMVKMADKGGPQ